MKKENLQTPAILLDMKGLQHNIESYADAAKQYNKQIWPMVKTHKSTKIAKMQADAGATGFLCGTLDECEALCDAGFDHLMYAYPVASKESIERVLSISSKCDFVIRLDDLDGARMLNEAAKKANQTIHYTIIVDSGLHRFGVQLDQLVSFANQLKELKQLIFKGISSHPGHVYGASCEADIMHYVKDEIYTMSTAKQLLEEAGYSLEIVSSGSTPTFFDTVSNEVINIHHPGNYVYHDSIQLSTNTATEEECALTVLATIISHPAEDLYICDAGAKCLGLDQGAHGNSSIKGFGTVKNHPELVVSSLSEEVGKLHVEGKTNLKTGDKIEIIPNHSCSTANLTDYYICVEGEDVIGTIKVDIRGNKTKKNVEC